MNENESPPRKSIEDWNGESIAPGDVKDVHLAISESYSGLNVRIPLQIHRGFGPGPTVFVTAALHGDEINGTGAIRQLLQEPLPITSGAVVLVPVLNLLAFDRHSRYLPDRRDLNRSFPGSSTGSLAARMARTIFDEIVMRCDYGIDLHTAAVRRTNYPTVRADMEVAGVAKIAKAFGAEVILKGKGPKGAFRREATQRGCPTIVLEGGEVWKVEPGIVATAVRGVRNVLKSLGMLEGQLDKPAFQTAIKNHKWVRAERGGFLQFHVGPGDVVEAGQPLATNTTLLGRERTSLISPFDGVIIGMTTLPSVSPGEPVCHLGQLPKNVTAAQVRALRAGVTEGLEEQVVDELATNLLVVEQSNGNAVDGNPEDGNVVDGNPEDGNAEDGDAKPTP